MKRYDELLVDDGFIVHQDDLYNTAVSLALYSSITLQMTNDSSSREGTKARLTAEWTTHQDDFIPNRKSNTKK